MKEYIFEYENEDEFRKLERTLRKYNKIAYKKLVFDYYPELKEGNFLGELVSTNKKNNTETYELKLPTDSAFEKVHGAIALLYNVYEEEKEIMLETIEPKDILLDGCKSELTTYKGVMISKTYKEKDMFKINLLAMLDNKDK